MVFCQLYYTIPGEELFVLGDKNAVFMRLVAFRKRLMFLYCGENNGKKTATVRAHGCTGNRSSLGVLYNLN